MDGVVQPPAAALRGPPQDLQAQGHRADRRARPRARGRERPRLLPQPPRLRGRLRGARQAARRARVAYYHAELDADERERASARWSRGEIKLIVATLAFGMGVNKPDVRYVFHFSMPKSLANYYQESGRAGRDGLGALCVLFFAWKDRAIHQAMITDKTGRRGAPKSQAAVDAELAALRAMKPALRRRPRAVPPRDRARVLRRARLRPRGGLRRALRQLRRRPPVESRDLAEHAARIVRLLDAVGAAADTDRPVATRLSLADAYRARTRPRRASSASPGGPSSAPAGASARTPSTTSSADSSAKTSSRRRR